ncbi:transposase [Aestuariivirga sp.]|uniref:IS66-like element accessory protein TnpA n=1 Tax=Aestuariivirga sp. TaxID=2650926 RepID=UPI0030160A73
MPDKSGTLNRRRYELSFKRQMVAETFAEGATIAAVARRHGLNANLLFNWRRDRRFNGLDGKAPKLLAVEIAPDAIATGGHAVSLQAAPRQIDIEVGGKVRVRCLEDISRDALSRVFSVLRRLT